MSEEHYKFDSARRFAALREALTIQLGGDGSKLHSLLDVGGFPCQFASMIRLRQPNATITTADVIPHQAENYIQISPGPLTFETGAFDYVSSSDTLEHVPPAHRAEFLSECARAARLGVLLGAPFEFSVTSQIEQMLHDAHLERTGRPHPWLHEHREHGLPRLIETIDAFASRGMKVGIALSAPLTEWMVWMWGEVAQELSLPVQRSREPRDEQLGKLLAHAQCTPPRAELWWIDESMRRVPFLPYRFIVAAVHGDCPAGFPVLENAATAIKHLEADAVQEASAIAMGELLSAMVSTCGSTNPSTGDGSAHLVPQLTRALTGLEAEYAALKGKQGSADRSPLNRLLGKFRR